MAGNPPTGSVQLELRLLGHFELARPTSGDRIPVPAAKMRALLAYLAAAPRCSETRRRVAGLLWEKSGEDQARQSLRQLLSNFRRVASAESSRILRFDDNTVSLDLALLGIDRTALIEIRPDADVAELSRVADLYRDDFGLELEIGESDFDGWLRGERIRCRDAAISLFDRLVRMLSNLGRHEEALTRANRLAAIDPTREETHRLVIAEEAVVSGRASAMQRYEAFRQVLRDELSVRPEAATLRLLDELRRQPTPDTSPDSAVETGVRLAEAMAVPVSRAMPRGWQLAMFAAALAVALPLGGMMAMRATRLFDTTTAYIDDDTGRASVAVLPFETALGHEDLRARVSAHEAQVRSSFAGHNRLSVVGVPDGEIPGDPVKIGRALRVRYVVKTVLSEMQAGIEADVSLIDVASGATLRVIPVPVDGTTFKFAREVIRPVFTEIALDRARVLAATDPDSTPGLLWRAAAIQVSSRVGGVKPEELAMYNKVLDRDPKQLYALLGLGGALILRVAREQSPNRRADIELAQSVMDKAHQQSPNLAEVFLEQGMLKKLQRQYQEAIPDFLQAVHLDPTQWIAPAQVAHCKMFVGRLDDAYQEMEATMANLLPDIGASESAFIAAETALVAGHPDKALVYLDLAVSGNPTMPRLQAMRAAALWMEGREHEAAAAAALSQTLTLPGTPTFAPETMSKRGGPEASQEYLDGNTRYAAAFRSALALAARTESH
jgi:DNA-binding SARP family transcriptional activator